MDENGEFDLESYDLSVLACIDANHLFERLVPETFAAGSDED